MYRRKIHILILTLFAILFFISCTPDKVEVVRTYINEDNHIIVVYSDNTEKDFGSINIKEEVKIIDTKVNEELHVIVTYSDGTTKDLGYVGVVDESLNVTVTDTKVDENLHVIVTYSDGTVKDLGYVGVVDESLNVTVTDTKVDEALHVIVTYSDGTVKDLGYVGVIDESLNVTVTDTKVDEKMHLIVKYSDGTTKDLGYVGVVDESLNVTVTDTKVDENMHLIVKYSDGTTKDLGYVGVIDESLNVKVVETKVDEKMHLIVKYSDGTTKDLGYVGVEVKVEVEPPLYVVTFLDYYGNEIEKQEVYRGKSAKAPSVSEIQDKVFKGWDIEFTNVQSDLTVKAVYENAPEYTVTFVDMDGSILKTETVIKGHSATAPQVSNKEDYIFTGWDKAFTNVQSDLTVKATFRQKNTYTITYKDYSGIVLATSKVKEGDTAVAPVTPTREGYTFKGWSSSLSNITSNKTVTAQYLLVSGTNILDIQYTKSGNKITVKFVMNGTVKFCGMEGSVELGEGVTYVSHTDGDGATANFKDGVLYFMFASNNGKNVTTSTTIMTVVFNVSDSLNETTLETIISDIYDQNYENVDSKVIGESIKLK